MHALDLALLMDAVLAGQPYPADWTELEEDTEAFARAWDACSDGRARMAAYVLAETDLRPVVRAALGCAQAAASYESVANSPRFPIADAFAAIDRWLEAPASVSSEVLEKYSSDVASWVKWVAGSSSAHAIADVIQLTHGIASGKLRFVPRLARDAIDNAAHALVEDMLRVEGAPDSDAAVVARLLAAARAMFAELVRELLPRPRTTARALASKMAGLSGHALSNPAQ